MGNINSLKRVLTDKVSVEIIPAESQDLEGRVWAINWFNYQAKWLYNLYNRLAAKYVIKMGGQLLFKGHNQQILFGDENLSRQTLLIVTYPSINNFLNMLVIKGFQLTSLLRVRAVKEFVFGFTKRLDNSEPSPAGLSDSYMVYHYQGNIVSENISRLAETYNLEVFFHGEKVAQLKRIEEGKDDVLAPFFMDGIIVFKANNDEDIEKFSSSEDLKQQNNLQNTYFAAKFTRIK